jgi:hypothetical protein
MDVVDVLKQRGGKTRAKAGYQWTHITIVR